MTNRKKNSHRRGLIAEMAARAFLRLKGYRILETRYRNYLGEIDLIVRKKDTLIAVEIKFRSSQNKAAESINKKQQNRINRAFSAYIAKILWEPKQYRFDVILISPYSFPLHLKNAWQIEN